MQLKLLAAAAALLFTGAAAHAAIDVVQAPTGYFVPNDSLKYDGTYWRGASQDWSWTHGGIAAGFSSASLNISAFDVDQPQGENDNIYAYDAAASNWVLLGNLDGGNDIWQFTTFELGADLFDDVVAGLQVRIDIDTSGAGWYVTLAKSTLTTDGAGPGNPNPGVPEPATWAMLIAGFGLVGATMRRRRANAVHA